MPESVHRQAVTVTAAGTKGGGHLFPDGRRGSYDPDFLARVLMFSFHLHLQSDTDVDGYGKSQAVKKVFMRAVRMMPAAIRELCERLFADATIPSKTTISRANLFIDVSFMHIMADRHCGMILRGSILFGLSDASPQGGIEYQVTEYYSIDGEMLIEAGQAAIYLKSFPKRPADIENLEQQLFQMGQLMDTVRAAKDQHVFPPQCMAQRQTSLAHKGHCLVRQLRLETRSWVETSQFAALFFSFTNDRGPERGFKRVHYDNLDQFPEWRPSRIVPESDFHLAAEDVDPIISLRHTLDISGMFLGQSLTYFHFFWKGSYSIT